MAAWTARREGLSVRKWEALQLKTKMRIDAGLRGKHGEGRNCILERMNEEMKEEHVP